MNITTVKVEILLPETFIESIRNQLNALGILTIGNYDHVISYTETKGYWRPLDESSPYSGERNKISFGSECKLEFTCEYLKIHETLKIIKDIHPYEEPIINIIPLLDS
ncbi:cytochrome C biogenesis protein [Solibacillus sp. FSL K6-1523]|uniref:cytochrome C biogenesis protein n=1 Tax=Solibacillus sp. FSL K6-1523 TaxID=2921471 RepID=UPI0030FA92C4